MLLLYFYYSLRPSVFTEKRLYVTIDYMLLGSNSKVWDLSPKLEVWDYGVGFIWPSAHQAQCLAFVIRLSQDSY